MTFPHTHNHNLHYHYPVASCCELHPHESVTGFCASCLRERLAGLDDDAASASSLSARKSTSAIKSLFSRPAPHPQFLHAPSSSSSNAAAFLPPDLRRCKSFSARTWNSASADADLRGLGTLGTLFHQDDRDRFGNGGASVSAAAVSVPFASEINEEAEDLAGEMKPMKMHIDLESKSNKKPSPKESSSGFWIAASAFSKKWQDWRRKQKLKKQAAAAAAGSGGTSKAAAAAMPPPTKPPKPSRYHRRSFRDTQSEVGDRRSCDTDPRFSMDAGRISFDFSRYSFEEPRASWDGYLVSGRPVFSRLQPTLSTVEDAPAIPRSDGQIPVEEETAMPGGSAQTRDYYLDSSSRRRRSFERSLSARKTPADVDSDRKPTIPAANSKVSPAGGAEFYHYHHAGAFLDRDSSLRDDASESFESVFRDPPKSGTNPKKAKRWIKGWNNILGFMHKKGNNNNNNNNRDEAENGVERSLSESWPELRARGCSSNGGQFLRSNSSVSARSSFSGYGARRNSVEMNGPGHGHGWYGQGQGKKRRDELMLDRNRSQRYSPGQLDNGMLRFYLTPTSGGQSGRRSSGVRPINSLSFSSRNPNRLY